jgi:hypothetical protein
MTTAQLALLISFISILIATASFVWNIYRDVALKAKVDVSFAVVFIIHETLPHQPQYLNLKITNFGPGVVNISMIFVKEAELWRRLFRKTRHAVVNADYTNPMSSRLPAKIAVGDKIELLLPYDKDCFLKSHFTHVGVSDYYGRVHWAPRRQLKKAYESWHKDFENKS